VAVAARWPVLIVDDEEVVLDGLARVLRPAFDVSTAPSAAAAFELVQRRRPFAVVVCDLAMPDLDGAAALAWMAGEAPETVAVLLTGTTDFARTVDAVNRGGVFRILLKPCPSELVVATVTEAAWEHERRLGARSRAAVAGAPMDWPGLRIDPASRTVEVDGEGRHLTRREFDLLAFLAAHPNRTFSRRQLLAEVWSSSVAWQDADTVTEHVRRVRRKIERDPRRPRWLVTSPGGGYRFAG